MIGVVVYNAAMHKLMSVAVNVLSCTRSVISHCSTASLWHSHNYSRNKERWRGWGVGGGERGQPKYLHRILPFLYYAKETQIVTVSVATTVMVTKRVTVTITVQLGDCTMIQAFVDQHIAVTLAAAS